MPIILQNCFGAKYNNQIEWAFSPETAAYSQTGTLPQNETNACFAVLQEIKTLLETKKNAIIKSKIIRTLRIVKYYENH